MKRLQNLKYMGILLPGFAAVPLAAQAGESERRQLDAHEHGVTAVNIALDGNTLMIEMEGPAMNFVGFEHTPETAEQKQAIADTLQTLNNDRSLFGFDSAADCVLAEADIIHIIDDDHDHDEEHDKDHDHHDDDHDGDEHAHDAGKATHSEFAGEYRFECGNPAKLTAISVDLFEQFPLTTEVEASFIGPDTQTFAELTADESSLEVRP